MNASSFQRTYIRMQNQLLIHPKDQCWLVEMIAPMSRNVIWKCHIDNIQVEHPNIRRVSIDKFYELVTGEKDAFYQLCTYLPYQIEQIIKNTPCLQIESDTVLNELRSLDKDLQTALFKLAFSTYEGFSFL